MKLELISHALCPFVHRAAIMLREKGVPFDRRTVDLKNKPDWFLAISPRGKVPVLVADGVALFESAAICEFLDETHPPRMVPGDPFERARQRAWVEVANDLLAAQFKAFVADEPTEAVKTRAAVAALLVRFEEAIGVGLISETAFSLIHVAVAPVLHRFVVAADRLGVDLLAGHAQAGGAVPQPGEQTVRGRDGAGDFGNRFVQILAERAACWSTGPKPCARRPRDSAARVSGDRCAVSPRSRPARRWQSQLDRQLEAAADREELALRLGMAARLLDVLGDASIGRCRARDVVGHDEPAHGQPGEHQIEVRRVVGLPGIDQHEVEWTIQPRQDLQGVPFDDLDGRLEARLGDPSRRISTLLGTASSVVSVPPLRSTASACRIVE